jgi:hypothetical protein
MSDDWNPELTIIHSRAEFEKVLITEALSKILKYEIELPRKSSEIGNTVTTWLSTNSMDNVGI